MQLVHLVIVVGDPGNIACPELGVSDFTRTAFGHAPKFIVVVAMDCSAENLRARMVRRIDHVLEIAEFTLMTA